MMFFLSGMLKTEGSSARSFDSLYLQICKNERSLQPITFYKLIKGEVSPNNNVDWVSREQFYKPNSKSVSRFG